MNLIHHVFDIKAPPELLFSSITTADGLSAWWTTKVQADNAEIGSLFLFTFRGRFNPQLRITEIESPYRGRVSPVTMRGAQPLSVSNSTELTEERW